MWYAIMCGNFTMLSYILLNRNVVQLSPVSAEVGIDPVIFSTSTGEHNTQWIGASYL